MLKNGFPVSAAYNDGVINQKIYSKNQNIGGGSIPKVGSIILFNEVHKWQDRNMPKPDRGCGIVTDETDYLVFIDRAIYPGYFIKTSFPKTDFLVGIVIYVEMKDFIYSKYTPFKELDIKRLNDNVKELVVNL